MKTKHYFLSLMVLLCLNFSNSIFAQQVQSSQKKDKLTNFYKSVRNPEISLQQFLKIQSQAAASQRVAAFSGCGVLHDLCGNGGFETGLDPNQWQGAYGTWASGDPDPASLTEGLVSGTGSLFDADAHQTVISKDIDPIVGISTVSDSGGTQSLRLGNAITGFGTELISKTIKVTPTTTILRFSYAVVFQDPGHPFVDQPAFSVRAFDCATGQELLNVCNLGNGSYKVVSDAANPFFQSINHSTYGLMAFRDWTSSFVDLSAYIGQTVNIQFTNKDCGQGAHFGYTYLDAFCEGGVVDTAAGSVVWNPSSDTCGNGSLCVDYILGGTSDGTTGTAVLHLGIYQNGALVTTLNSDTLTTDSSTYCFGINPSSLGLDNSAGGFDYVLNSDFQLKGFNYQLLPLGNPPLGQDSLANNDYKINCGVTDTACTHICLRDNYLYQWKLCYKKQGTTGTASGTVNLGGAVIWSAWGWIDCNSGKMELHAINPNPDCTAGYTDSFVYKGISITKCHKTPFRIGIGGGKWASYCGGNVSNKGNFGMITCLDRDQFNKSSEQITPARSSGPANSISLKVSPNPIQNSATVNYSLAKESKVNIVIYNYMMQPIKTLESGTKSAGNYSVKWDARRSDGSSAGSGLYKIVANVNGKIYTTTLQIIK